MEADEFDEIAANEDKRPVVCLWLELFRKSGHSMSELIEATCEIGTLRSQRYGVRSAFYPEAARAKLILICGML
jgi:hypothetical protein